MISLILKLRIKIRKSQIKDLAKKERCGKSFHFSQVFLKMSTSSHNISIYTLNVPISKCYHRLAKKMFCREQEMQVLINICRFNC